MRLSLLCLVLVLAWAAPASAKLVYVKGTEAAPVVHIADDDGSPSRALAKGTDPRIAPDALTVAFVRRAGSRQELRIVGAARGSEERRLTAASRIESVEFSPDSKLLAAEVGGRRLMIFEVATGRMATLARGAFKGLSFSPDSQRIAYGLGVDATAMGASDIFTVPAVGGEAERLTDDGRSLLPVWGAQRIAFAKRKGVDRTGTVPTYDIWAMTGEGTRVRRVTRTKVPDGVSGLLPLEWSADGRRLIAQYVGADVRVGFTVNPFTGRTRSLRRKVAFALARDGSAVLTHSGAAGARTRNVYSAPYAGGRSTLLARNARLPDWSR